MVLWEGCCPTAYLIPECRQELGLHGIVVRLESSSLSCRHVQGFLVLEILAAEILVVEIFVLKILALCRLQGRLRLPTCLHVLARMTASRPVDGKYWSTLTLSVYAASRLGRTRLS